MSAHPAIERKTYTMPVLRYYGSVVAATRGSKNNGNDAAGTQTKN